MDYDKADAAKIESLLEELRKHPERKQEIYQELNRFIFGLRQE